MAAASVVNGCATRAVPANATTATGWPGLRWARTCVRRSPRRPAGAPRMLRETSIVSTTPKRWALRRRWEDGERVDDRPFSLTRASSASSARGAGSVSAYVRSGKRPPEASQAHPVGARRRGSDQRGRTARGDGRGEGFTPHRSGNGTTDERPCRRGWTAARRRGARTCPGSRAQAGARSPPTTVRSACTPST